MAQDSLVFGSLTLAVVGGLVVMILGVLQDAESVNALLAVGAAITVGSVLLIAAHLARMPDPGEPAH